jgi:hypothetical protein
MAASLPLSYWLPGELYITPSSMATFIFAAFRTRARLGDGPPANLYF